jgi:hypothetical protein
MQFTTSQFVVLAALINLTLALLKLVKEIVQ